MNLNTTYTPVTGTTEKSIDFVLLGEASPSISRPAAAFVSMTSETGRTAYQIRVIDADTWVLEVVAYTSWTLALARWANLLVEKGASIPDAYLEVIGLMEDCLLRVYVDRDDRFRVI